MCDNDDGMALWMGGNLRLTMMMACDGISLYWSKSLCLSLSFSLVCVYLWLFSFFIIFFALLSLIILVSSVSINLYFYLKIVIISHLCPLSPFLITCCSLHSFIDHFRWHPYVCVRQLNVNLSYQFLMGHPRPLFRLFSSFQTHNTSFITIKCKNYPSSIWC